MIRPDMLDRFLSGVAGQALVEGTRYAQEGRVEPFVPDDDHVVTVVRGRTGDFQVTFTDAGGELLHDCDCPSWRSPCKHRVAAAQMLRQGLRASEPDAAAPGIPQEVRPAFDAGDAARANVLETVVEAAAGAVDPGALREAAIEERRMAGRREPLAVRVLEELPVLAVTSSSGFAYRVRVRGGPAGPHGCTCPDFEANRLHTCKHVERVRAYLTKGGRALDATFRRAAARARVYLHFGEVVEPRLFGRPSGRGAPDLRNAFGDAGRPRRRPPHEPAKLLEWLGRFGSWVEPEAIAWLEVRAARLPHLGRTPFRRLVPSLGGEPYPYQWTGAEFLARAGRALLADEMGLGKTVQAIIAAAALRRASPSVRHVTIVCPASLRGGWQDEIRRWLGEEAELLAGNARERAKTIASRPAWLITHYEQVLRDHRHHTAAPPDLLIVDEAQRAKGIRTKTARTLKAIEARHVFALTGTPLENRLEEAYAIAQLIDQRLLPPLWQLDRDHFVRPEGSRRVEFYRDLGRLRSQLAPAFLRRRKEDVALELPEQVRSVAELDMHAKVVETYEDVMRQVKRIANKRVLLPADIERMMRLLVIARRCCNGPHMLGQEVDDGTVPKLRELEQALRELCLGEGRKAVVFSEWTDMTNRVETLCRRLDVPVFHLHGGVNIRNRPALIRSFTRRSGPAVFISTDAGGVGLNLQAADVLVNLDLPWNPARLEQRIARVHRIGSKQTVRVLLLVCRSSIEAKILLLHDTKRNVFENVFATNGEDVIAAPGGSGKFRDMVQALLEAEDSVADYREERRDEDGNGAVSRATAVDDAAVDAAADAAADAAPDAAADAAADAAPDAAADAAADAAEHRTPGERARPEPPATADAPRAFPAPEAAPSAPPVDPATVAAAVAAVAPTLPLEHRRSLATVFRALADALEE